MTPDGLEELKLTLRRFTAERGWDKFHSPKNLTLSLMIEAAEIAEHFQWSDPPDASALPPEKREEIALEIADTLIYLVELADLLQVDMLAAAQRKMAINAVRYPVDKVYGRAVKYTEL